jgi:hypothetical protein
VNTTASRRTLIRGVLAEAKDGHVVIAVPESDYRVRLVLDGELKSTVGDKVHGAVHAQARRIDVIKSGGAYVEPVNGRPRRVQGRIVEVDAPGDTITVFAGACGITCLCAARQRASQFKVDQLVSMDVEPGATFTPGG